MRSLRLAAAVVLAASALAAVPAAVPAAQAAAEGRLTVKVVDANGSPDIGQIQIIGPGGVGAEVGAVGYSAQAVDVPPGNYAAIAVTPWGGFSCVGVDVCSYIAAASGQFIPNGDVVVTAGGTTTATIRAAVPATIGGGHMVGDTLTVDLSPGLLELTAVLGGVAQGGLTAVQWLRDGTPIAGATGTSYVATPADTGKHIAARLMYGVALGYIKQLTGVTQVDPFITDSVTVKKRSSKTYIRMVRSTFTAGQQGVARVDVTSPNSVVTGKVKVAVGDWAITRALRNGRAVVRLPRLVPGTYQVTAAYQGTGAYAASSAKPKKVKVTR